MISQDEKTQIDADVAAAFGTLHALKPGASAAEVSARSAEVARKVYDLTRPLGLKRQKFEDSPPYKPAPGIPLNAFAKRRLAGLLGKGLPGYPFDAFGRARVADAKPKTRRTRAAITKTHACPHCGGKLAA